jgi:hypothetical protein
MKLPTTVFAIALFVVVCASVAQETAAPAKAAEHHHYKLIDLGTFADLKTKVLCRGPETYKTYTTPTRRRYEFNKEDLADHRGGCGCTNDDC